jgi:hypothetical protein
MDKAGDKNDTADGVYLNAIALEKRSVPPIPQEENREDCKNLPGERPGRRTDAKWEEMFSRLEVYKEKHGDCLVPSRYPEDSQLGSWGKSLFLL